ncbi:MAG: HDOD domain-containing protein [Phycisphaerales bacterium]|nr:HDOD domain-containing protein [Phycisphaerales bacterium]
MSVISSEPAQGRLKPIEEFETVLASLPPKEQSRIESLMTLLYRTSSIGAAETAAVVGEDVTLAARLIRVANTVHYGAGIPVMNAEAATVRLGADRTKALAIASYAGDLLGQVADTTFQFNRFWQVGLIRGSLARAIAMNCDRRLAGKAFLVGVLQSIGVPLMTSFGAKYASLIEKSQGCLQRLAILEWQSFNFNHIHVALHLLEQWKTPVDVKTAIARHQTNPPLGSDVDAVLRLWQIAYFVNAVPLGIERPTTFKDAFLSQLLNSCFGEIGTSISRLLEQARAEYEDVAGLFESYLSRDVGVEEQLRPIGLLLRGECNSSGVEGPGRSNCEFDSNSDAGRSPGRDGSSQTVPVAIKPL